MAAYRIAFLLSLPLRRPSVVSPCRHLSRRREIALALDDRQAPAEDLLTASERSGALPTDSGLNKPASQLPHGFLVVHKPQGWTSFDVVGKIRGVLEKHFKRLGHKFGRRSRLKVGHGGTLDPMATGLLVVGVGDGCRRLQQYLTGPKAYVATAQLGMETDTQDAEGAATRSAPHEHVTLAELQMAAEGLTGEIMQRPPIYSALRKDGKRLYDLARAGEIRPEDVELRPVRVHALRVARLDETSGTFHLMVRCSGGTYVRTLIEDLGRAVGSAAHMTALERTRHGPFCSGEEAVAAAASADPSAARLVTPLVEADLSDPATLIAAVEAAGDALDELRSRQADAAS